jgi:hypothetical protein
MTNPSPSIIAAQIAEADAAETAQSDQTKYMTRYLQAILAGYTGP